MGVALYISNAVHQFVYTHVVQMRYSVVMGILLSPYFLCSKLKGVGLKYVSFIFISSLIPVVLVAAYFVRLSLQGFSCSVLNRCFCKVFGVLFVAVNIF